MVTSMAGIGRRAGWSVVAVTIAAAIVGWLWHVVRSSEPPRIPRAPQRADAYEGSSGMGADGFGGYPSRPDAP
jgi:hypothetical protein